MVAGGGGALAPIATLNRLAERHPAARRHNKLANTRPVARGQSSPMEPCVFNKPLCPSNGLVLKQPGR